MELSQSQIDTLKNKGLSLDKIQAIATQRGYDMPKSSFVSSLVKSERGFGQSIAGAIGGTFQSLAGGNAIEDSNRLSRQVKENLFTAINQKKAKGEDTSKLLNALKTMDSEINFYDILNESTGGSLDKTGRQIFGEGLGVATDIIGLGKLPAGVGQMTKASTFGSGVVQGAKAGAIGGGLFGTAQGVARSAQDNKTAGEIVGEGLKGGLV